MFWSSNDVVNETLLRYLVPKSGIWFWKMDSIFRALFSFAKAETMSLAKAAIFFRALGLRHLLVVPKTPGRPPIVGILTRHDFMPEHILELFPQLNPHE
ncbi:hypothetical protein ACFX12_044698 [Malus domestica]